MRFMTLLLAILLMTSFHPLYADEIKCYSGGKLIYEIHGQKITYSNDGITLIINDKKNEQVILTSDCIIKLSN